MRLEARRRAASSLLARYAGRFFADEKSNKRINPAAKSEGHAGAAQWRA